MPEGTINCYNLAESGVNVDKAQIHKQDGELTKAQNCTTDPTGMGGGVRKRPGLVTQNSVAGAGSIVGGIGVPLGLEAGTINGVTLAAAVRTQYYGRQLKSAGAGANQGWWTSVDGFVTTAGVILAGTPANPRGAVELSDGSSPMGSLGTGMPGSVVTYRNKLFYAGSYTVGTDKPTVRIFDGVSDTEFVRIPHNPNFTDTNTAILSMLLVGDTIYLSTRDGNTANESTTRTGRVFSLNTSSGALVQIGAQFPSGYRPYSLCWHMGRLWAGSEYKSGGVDVPGDISWIRPNIDLAWTLDRTMSLGRGCAMLISYKGELFAGSWGGNAGVTSVIEKRTTLGVWSVSLSVAASYMFMNAVQFGTNLYCTLTDTIGSTDSVRKYDGASWTTALSAGENQPLPQIWVDNGILFAGGGGGNLGTSLYSSPDGAAWTSRTANLPSNTTINGLTAIGTLVT